MSSPTRATTRVHARVPAGDQDSWTRKLEIGQPISVGFRPRDAKLFDVSAEIGAASAAAAPAGGGLRPWPPSRLRRSRGPARALGDGSRWVGVVGFVAVLAYLVVLPLIRLQTTALEDGAQGYRTAFGAPGIGDVLLTTVAARARLLRRSRWCWARCWRGPRRSCRRGSGGCGACRCCRSSFPRSPT